MKDSMAIDQFGHTEHHLGAHPRKELLRRMCATKAAKMYIDGVDGDSYHVGWIVAGRWFTVYAVEPMRVKA